MIGRILLFLMAFLSVLTLTNAQVDSEKVRSEAFSQFLTQLEAGQPGIELRPNEMADSLVVAIYGRADDVRSITQLSSAISAVGRSRAVRFAVPTDQKTLPRLASENTLRVTLGVDRSRLKSELGKIFDSYAGTEGVFELVLKNMAEDPNGPMVDVEKDFIGKLGRTWVLMNDTSQENFRWLIAISVQDEVSLSNFLKRWMQRQRDAQVIEENYYIVRSTGVAVKMDWLLIGEATFVRAAIPLL